MLNVTITTPAYRAGQRALLEAVSAHCEPNWPLARKLGAEFFAGFGSEWEDITAHEVFTVDEVAENAARRLKALD